MTIQQRSKLKDLLCIVTLLLYIAILLSSINLNAQNLTYGAPYIIPLNASTPSSIAIDESRDRLLVLDTGGRRVLYATISDFETGNATWSDFGFIANVTHNDALLEPQGIAVDPNGNVYVSDTRHNRVRLYRYDSSTNNYNLDNGFTASNPSSVNSLNIKLPRDVAVGPDGKIWLLDSGNHRILIADGPEDSDWSLWGSNVEWINSYGLDVGPGDEVLLAISDRHEIRRYAGNPGTSVNYGRFGTDSSSLRFPRDVARHPNAHAVIADTWNHRIRIISENGSLISTLGDASFFHTPSSVAVDSQGRIFVVDSGYNRVIAWLGPDAPKPFDLYIQDYLGDVGNEPSSDPGEYLLSSPDILIRHSADLDLSLIGPSGLQSIPFEQPRLNENNYIYLEIRNKGPMKSRPAQVRMYWADPSGDHTFPSDWYDEGFYRSWTSVSSNLPGNYIQIPEVPPSSSQIVGPLIFRPPPPSSVSENDGRLDVVARIICLDDSSLTDSGLDGIRRSNNIARRGMIVDTGPFTVGEQNTLVVLVKFNNTTATVNLDSVKQKISETGQWISEVSYNQAWIKPLYRGPVLLNYTSAHYNSPNHSLLVDMAEEVIGKLLISEPTLLDGQNASDPEDDIDRIILVTNDFGSPKDWATTGSWPYSVPGGGIRYLSVSVHGPLHSCFQYAHGLSHQMNLKDLYAHENVEFPRPFADGWDNMALPFNGVHPMVWSKQHADWVTKAGGKITWIPRPPSGGEIVKTVRLKYQADMQSGDTAAVVVGLTEGATSLEAETQYYWLESRSNEHGSFDEPVGSNGVLMYLVSELIPQGQGPVIVRDHVPVPADDLSDAVIPVGDQENPAGSGLYAYAYEESNDKRGYMVRIFYDPPDTDYDLWMKPGDPYSYMSPDIWIDNLSDGYDGEPGNDPIGPPDENGIAGQENRVYALVRNTGPGDAYDVEVAFYFSSPYHTVDNVDDFDYLKSTFIDHIPAGENRTTFITWTPPHNEGSHHCVRVEVRRMTDDTNIYNNSAQRNLRIEESTMASPYKEVLFNYTLSNNEDDSKLIYMRVDDIPPDWQWSFDEPKILIAPGERHLGTLRVKPPDDTPACTEQTMQISAWRLSGDTLIQLGGTGVEVDLRRNVELTANIGVAPCRMPEGSMVGFTVAFEPSPAYLHEVGFPPWVNDLKQCAQLTIEGCTNPPQPNAEILVRYRDPDGNPIYRTVQTDEYGCYEDLFITADGGEWETHATYKGDDCNGSSTAGGTIKVPIDEILDHDNDGLPDANEGSADPNGNGIPCFLDPDCDGDGLRDGDEEIGDCDNDGIDNYMDADCTCPRIGGHFQIAQLFLGILTVILILIFILACLGKVKISVDKRRMVLILTVITILCGFFMIPGAACAPWPCIRIIWLLSLLLVLVLIFWCVYQTKSNKKSS